MKLYQKRDSCIGDSYRIKSFFVNSLTTLTIIFNFAENIWDSGAWSNLKTYLEYIAWESCFLKVFFLQMDRIFKAVLWVWNNSEVCLHLILFTSSLRIMSWRKQKYAQYKHLDSCHCIQSRRHIYGCSGSEIVVKQIFNLNHRLYTLQKYLICKSQVEFGTRSWKSP